MQFPPAPASLSLIRDLKSFLPTFKSFLSTFGFSAPPHLDLRSPPSSPAATPSTPLSVAYSALAASPTSKSLRPSLFSVAVGFVFVFINPPVPASQLAVAAIDLGLFLLLCFLLDAAKASSFFPCFLMASSPPSPLRPHPASSAVSFSSDAVLCCHHGLVVAVSLHWPLLSALHLAIPILGAILQLFILSCC